VIKVVLAALALALVTAAPAEARGKKDPWDIGELYKAAAKPHKQPRIKPIETGASNNNVGASGSSYRSRNNNPPSDSSYSAPSKQRRDSSSY